MNKSTRLANIAATICVACLSAAQAARNAALDWDTATLQGIRDSRLGAPIAARALAIFHTCMYDDWAAYDGRAIGTNLGGSW